VGGPLTRIIPIILAHQDKYDGSGQHPNQADEIPIEARVISVADVYDALTSDRPYRKAMSPFEAKE
jgi:HD-GYP domain-containing protein (c-di-GMP phosphodiesterase class II)